MRSAPRQSERYNRRFYERCWRAGTLLPMPGVRAPTVADGLRVEIGCGSRLLPSCVGRRWVRRFERDVGAGVFHSHPWELDPGSPVAPRLSRWLLRIGRRLPAQLHQLLRETRFAPVAEVFANHISEASLPPIAPAA